MTVDMKALLGYVLLAISVPLVLGISGFIYGWLCSVVSRSPEQLQRQRQIDMKLWTYLGPSLAVITIVTMLLQSHTWYRAFGFGAVGWFGCVLFKAGLYWSIARRLKNDAKPN